MKVTKISGMRLRFNLGDGQMKQEGHADIKFWLSYDTEGVIVELEEGESKREYFVVSFRDIVDDIISRRMTAEYEIGECLSKEMERESKDTP